MVVLPFDPQLCPHRSSRQRRVDVVVAHRARSRGHRWSFDGLGAAAKGDGRAVHAADSHRFRFFGRPQLVVDPGLPLLERRPKPREPPPQCPHCRLAAGSFPLYLLEFGLAADATGLSTYAGISVERVLACRPCQRARARETGRQTRHAGRQARHAGRQANKSIDRQKERRTNRQTVRASWTDRETIRRHVRV